MAVLRYKKGFFQKSFLRLVSLFPLISSPHRVDIDARDDFFFCLVNLNYLAETKM